MYNKLICTLTALFFFAAGQAQKYPSLLWEIKKTPNSKPSYLFGTYHISDKGVFKLGDSIFYALRNVDMVATEVNDNTWQQYDARLDSMKNGYALYNGNYGGAVLHEGVLRKTNTIQKLPVFISYQPGAINYFLYRNNNQKDGFEEEAYLDMFLSSAGFKLGKKVAGLEDILESEIKGMEGRNDEEELDKEENMHLPEGITADEISDLIFDGYKNNSLDMMDSLNKYMYSSDAYYKKFITARNYDQADSLDAYIRMGNTVFAAVGSAHLPGKEGVIEIMRKKGYLVRPVKLQGQDKAQIDAIKKMVAPVSLSPQHIENVITFKAPGPLYHHFGNALLRIYSWVDMANGAYYVVSRTYNNSFFFGKNNLAVRDAIDSLLYENIKGDIISRNKFEYMGWPAIDVTSRLRNKDLEKYRFIITPYELLRIKVGGKNQYVNMPVIDSFFNSFQLHLEQPVLPETGVQIAAAGGWHSWRSEYFTKPNAKLRFARYDKERNIMNGCIKIQIAGKDLRPDQHYLKLAAESFTSSFALKKEVNKNLDFSQTFGTRPVLYELEQGGTIAVQVKVQQPFLYLLYSAAPGGQPDTSWMRTAQFSLVTPPLPYSFSDSLKAVRFNMPYDLKIDNRWKSVKEKETDKPDTEKKLNRSEAIDYTSKTVFTHAKWDEYTLHHPASMEAMWAATIKIDSNFYYPNARNFWSNFIPRAYNSALDNVKSMYQRNTNSEEGRNMPALGKSGQYVRNVVYDTANAQRQRLQFVVADSASERAIYTVCILHNNRVYRFQTVVTAPGYGPSPFFSTFLATVQPFNNNQPFSVFENRLPQLVKDYLQAPLPKKATIAEQLNYYHFDAADLPLVTKAMQSLQEKTPANNILRRKLVDAMYLGARNQPYWPQVSDWLKRIYQDKSELLTIRYLALRSILSAAKDYDAPWILENMSRTADFKTNLLKRYLGDYFFGLENKAAVKNRLNLADLTMLGVSPSRSAFVPLRLYDSGFYNIPAMQAAFSNIQRLLADEAISLSLRAETDLFRYPETTAKKDVSDLRYDNNFQMDTDLFDIFYGALPGDPYFARRFDTIVAKGTPKDRLELLRTLVKQPRLRKAWVDTLLQGLEPEKVFYLDIYKMFAYYGHENSLPEKFRNPAELAYAYLKAQGGSRRDTLYYYNSSPSPYVKGETFYFFKYRDLKEKNDQVAYVVLPANLDQLLTRKRVRYEFTSEQEAAGNTFQALSSRLMRRLYISSLFSDSDRGFYLNEKDEKSLDALE